MGNHDIVFLGHASRNHAWLGPGQGACDHNSAIRREKYSKYWKIMTCLGAWTEPRYLQVKQDRANGGEWAISHRREVMLVCTLQQLRTLYPTQKINHTWTTNGGKSFCDIDKLCIDNDWE